MHTFENRPYFSMTFSINRFFESKLVSLICVLICCGYTIFNGYPILYSDTSTYISSGFELETPASRPITYGIMLRIFSLNGLSFFFVPVFQSLLFLYVLNQLLKYFFGNENSNGRLFICVAVFAIFTGYFWSVNELIPDFMSPLGMIALFLIAIRDRGAGKEVSMYFIFFICAASHFSNLFIYFILLSLFWLFRSWLFPGMEKRRSGKKALICLMLLIVSFLIMASAFSKSRNVFYAGSLAEKGILREILKDKCGSESMKMCEYRDSIRDSFEYLVWSKNSPLEKMGGWKASQTELRKLNGIANTESKYLKMQIAMTGRFFLQQLVMQEIAEGNGAFDQKTVLNQRIHKYAPLDASLCDSAMQQARGFIGMNAVNSFLTFSGIIFSVALFALFIWLRRRIRRELFVFIFVSVFFVLANALLTALTSQITQRVGCKLNWLLFLSSLMMLFSHFSGKKQTTETDQ
jgi:hypothetical protein